MEEELIMHCPIYTKKINSKIIRDLLLLRMIYFLKKKPFVKNS